MKRARILLAVALACSVPALALSCKHDATPAPEGGGGKKGGGFRGDGGLMFTVDTLRVESKKLSYVVTSPGTIEAFERVQVTARVAGVVDRVGFTEGQSVKKGGVLVVIDSERFQLAVNSARAAVDKAQAAQKDVEAMVGRREGASSDHPGLIPGEELETYRTKVLTAKADTAVASENLKIAELNLRDSSVRAPIDGVIQTRTVETGQFVQAGYVMATLLRSEPLLLRFQVEPLEAPRLKPGMVATFTMRETQRVYTAKITLVAAAADPTTHMVGVTAEVDNEDHAYWLRPGAFADVTVDVGATRDAPVIPRQATRATDHGYVTYVVDGDTVAERVIQLGMSSKDGWVEVRNGLSAGEWIVVRGAESLSTGARVRATRLASLDASAPMPDEADRGGDGGGAPAGSGSGRRRAGRPPGIASGEPRP